MDILNATVEYNVINTTGRIDPKTGVYDGLTDQFRRKEIDFGGRYLSIGLS